MKTIAVEDLITVVCETFVESLSELGYKGDISVPEWYMGKTDAERRVLSEKILDQIDANVRSDASERSGDRFRSVVRQSYSRPDTVDYDSPREYYDAMREWEHAQAVCGLRPIQPLDDDLPNDQVEFPKGSNCKLELEVVCVKHVVVDPWVCLDCWTKFEPTMNTQCPACLSGDTRPDASNESF